MCVPCRKYGLSNNCDIQNVSREYKLLVTTMLIFLQATSSYCLWMDAVITNVTVFAK